MKTLSLGTIIFALALPFLAVVNAFWRMNCAVIQTGRIDPLVNPGAVSAHAHTITGGSNIGVYSNFTTLLNSECTSCEIEGDKSAYWTPLLYYDYGNGSFMSVPHGGSVVYYLARGPNANNTIPYPPGFQMLSGDKGARSYNNVSMTWGNATYPGRPIADRVSFVCLPDGPPLPTYPYMFNTTCGNGMRAQICFQSCWNGQQLYTSDNSHVAYLSQIDAGVCPPGYPYQLPTLFIEVNYAVEQVPDQNPNGQFVFSQGDPTGYGFHGDFQNGWDPALQAAAIDQCLVGDEFGVVQECPVLNANDTNGYPWNCPQRPPQIGEPVVGLVDQLPGCITITPGPEEAPAASMECPAGHPTPSITNTPDSTPRATASPTAYAQQFGIAQQEYLGCYNDSAAGIRTLNAISTTNYTYMSVEWCQSWCESNGYRLSGVEYTQECHCDNEINPTAMNGTNQCSWHCGSTITGDRLIELTMPIELCGGLGYINVYKNTNPNFVAFGSNQNTAGNAHTYTPPEGFGSNYLGCYTDVGYARTLTGKSFQQNNMTIEICAAFCTEGSGYQYYGLEFATQCFCGDAISNNGTLLTPTSNPANNTACQSRCQGSEPEICGGANALSLYSNTGFVAPIAKPFIGKYLEQMCLTDPNGANGRALQGGYTASPNMTNEMCVKYCLGHEFHYAGLEYSTQCYCGNSIVADTGATVTSCSPAALMTCAGNDDEFCGGPSLLNLFYSPSL